MDCRLIRLKYNDNLIEAFKTSCLDDSIDSNPSLQNVLLVNNPLKQQKIITTLREELASCDEFIISVAFITESGVVMLLEQLQLLDNKGISGKILTGDYLNFTEPKALERLFAFKNIEIKLLNANLHAKGYFFRKNNIWNLIVGSSNLTQKALTTNIEWNLKISSLATGGTFKDIIQEFNQHFDSASKLTLQNLEQYKIQYKQYHDKYLEFMAFSQQAKLSTDSVFQPNSMQEQALNNLHKLRVDKKNKALLISATGTGKTYLSAFDVRASNPSRVLFIAHRKNILSQALETFQKVIPNKTMAIYEPRNNNSKSADYLFAMVQSLNKDEYLSSFLSTEFDYIIIDEVHHSGAKTYQRIINYFKPKFFLGMTATPERSDDFDIYALFNHNIAFEIRLHDALKENLLCPFHYFGVSDLIINNQEISEKSAINSLVCDERVEHILSKANFYGYSGASLHGLIFVSSKLEAFELSVALNKRGVACCALSAEDNDKKREQAIIDLTVGKLKYIISVDIFNEGLDIPCINQVIFLRPTQSAIVYVQQLGRGLRKNSHKEYVTILDFIANYERSFLIPIAISQDNTYDKDFLKRFVSTGSEIIPGESSIAFEEIVKEKIFANINQANFSTKNNIKHDFNLLKKRLGRVPYLYDFFCYDFIDPSVILKYKDDYDEILRVFDNDGVSVKNQLSIEEKSYLKFLSQFFTPAKRIHEIYILKLLIEGGAVDIVYLNQKIQAYLKLDNQLKNTSNALKHLTRDIFTSYSVLKNYLPLIVCIDNKYTLSSAFLASLKHNNYFKALVEDLINYNLAYVAKNFEQETQSTMLLYKTYSKEQAHRYLNLDYNNGLQVSGYNRFEEERVVTIFITFDASNYFTNHDNELINLKRFTWFSKNNRVLVRNNQPTLEGLIAQGFYCVEVFAKKTNSDNFYYLGKVDKVLGANELQNEAGQSIIKYTFELKNEIELSLYNYLKVITS